MNKVFAGVTAKDIEPLLRKGFSEDAPKSQYELIRLKGDCTVILYTSGKLQIQGSEDAVEDVADILRQAGLNEQASKPKVEQKVPPAHGWIIGSDETLKGDTFGGMIVAAVKADNLGREQLKMIGVADSKTLSELEINEKSALIRKSFQFSISSLTPEEYNDAESVTALLNRLHKEVGETLGEGTHIVDEYPGCNVGDIREEKAESKYLEVAAASILARAEGLRQFKLLSKEAGFELPKGSTHVSSALDELKKRKLDPKKFVKVDFKNVKAVFN